MKESAVFYPESCKQLVSTILSLGLNLPVINVVKIVAFQIIKHYDDLSNEGLALWAELLNLYDTFTTWFDDER